MATLRGTAGAVGLVVAAAITAGIVHGWGTGLFHPCGPVDRALPVSGCRVLAVLDGRSVEALLPLGAGRVLVATKTAGQDPAGAAVLAEMALPSGELLDERALALPAGGSWTDAAVAPDGSRLVVAMLDEPTRVLDAATGEVLAEIELYGLTPLGFAGPDEVRLGTDAAGLDRAPLPAARAFGALDGVERLGVQGAEALPLFRQGVSRVLSPDGTLLAQHVRTRADTGVVAVRLTAADAPEMDGVLLVAPLGAWLPEGQLFPQLSFSPSGSYLAASFDGAAVWGRATSALLVWDVETRELVRRVPTREGRWEHLVWREDERDLAASRFDPESGRGEVALIEY